MTTRTKCWLVVAVFVIGVIGGILIGIYRPNDITFVIRANGEVNLVPRSGDVVHWIAEDPNGEYTATPPTVNFYSKSPKKIPCTATPDPTTTTYSISDCEVTSVPLDYFYDCLNPVTKRPCKDPQWGPGSGPHPHLETLKITLSDVFHDFNKVESSPLPTAPAAIPPPDGGILCTADGTPKVTPITYSVSSGETIEWSSSVDSYSFDLNAASPAPVLNPPPLGPLGCSEQSGAGLFSSAKPHSICTLENYGIPGTTVWTYHVNVTGCSSGTSADGLITIVQ